ncbi:ROP-interactive CRIB motif-containing protein 6 [Actinidia rufa]|uniref:ROP-interactive CRIB motif-containing protein 6 n=1 Tax=Actinidia rufa TaxID=165716 RepID=A0A7J0H3S3_9ERIC|nr:ROP-interactive CRIB motif-containing protein 6 [Actinidia rufa]
MGTKMKGLLKGLRYITQKFDDDKESEMEIGYPTDVKHVAHIGWDGPSVDSPSWMKEFTSPHGFQSAPLSANGEPKENPEIKWVSQDSSRRSLRSQNSAANDMPELPKSSRRHSTTSGSTAESPTGDSSTKSRQSRRNSSNGSKPTRQSKELGNGSDSSSQTLPDIPKKSRRKKSKESESGGSTRSSRSKAHAPIEHISPFSDPRPENGFIPGSINNKLSQSSSLKPFVEEGD